MTFKWIYNTDSNWIPDWLWEYPAAVEFLNTGSSGVLFRNRIDGRYVQFSDISGPDSERRGLILATEEHSLLSTGRMCRKFQEGTYSEFYCAGMNRLVWIRQDDVINRLNRLTCNE